MDTITRLTIRILDIAETPRDDAGFTLVEAAAVTTLGVVVAVALVTPLRTGLESFLTSMWSKLNGA